MGWLTSVARRFATPGAVPTSQQYFGIASDDWKPEEYGAYVAKSTYVHICVQRRAQDLASLPIALYRTTNGGKKPVEVGNLRMLLDKVNPFWTSNRLINMTEQSLCLWGESFWFLERGAGSRGVPREIWWARPDRVKVYPDPANYVSHFGYTPEEGAAEQRFETSETIWLRKPNPLNQWAGLSPLVAARLSADAMSAAMRSNYAMFSNGMRIAGLIGPKNGGPIWTDDQVEKIQQGFDRKFKGAENAHKWAIFKSEMSFSALQMSQKDAEFVELHRMSKEDICNSYGVPLDLIGGQRTFENYSTAREAYWSDTIIPEAAWIAAELTEQLLPMFGEADVAEFDDSDVAALKENENDLQMRVRENATKGLMIYDEARVALGLDPLPNGQGQVLMIPSGLTVIKPEQLLEKADMAMEPPPAPVAPNAPDASQDAPQQAKPRAQMYWGDGNQWQGGPVTFTGSSEHVPVNMRVNDTLELLPSFKTTNATRAVAYGSDEHRRLWERAVSRTDRHEQLFGNVTASLMRDQRKSVLSRLNGRTARAADPEDLAASPFILAEWVKKFRAALRPVYLRIVQETAEAALSEIGVGISFNVQDPNVLRFIETRSQRFAQQVNETTWNDLRASLRDGIDAGESIDDLAKRVNDVMGDRIRSSAETIARTETIGASNGGTLESWRQSGVVKGKTWLAALDERTRDTHIEAHNQTVPIDSDFLVGGGAGPAPGQIGLAEEDCNCRCAMTAVLDVDWEG